MKRKQLVQLIIAVFSLSALMLGFYLLTKESADPERGLAATEVEDSTARDDDRVDSSDAPADENLESNPDSHAGIAADEQSRPAPSVESSPSVKIEEALLQRKIARAEIAAKYSSSGDGILSEADFRRHAEERYLKRRDLNGNGRLDGFELRAIGLPENSGRTDLPEEVKISREQ